MSKLLASTCVGLSVMFLLGCQPTTPDDKDEEDLPAVPIEADDAAQAMAVQICGGLFACECANTAAFASEDDCVTQKTAQIQSEIDTLLTGGGTWNAECAGELSKTWTKWECLGPLTATHESAFDPRVCPIIKGTLNMGDNCWTMGTGDSCREGLSCIDQVCIESPTLPVPIGSACESQWETLPCEAGSYCEWSSSGPPVCTPRPVAGDACNPNEDYLCGLSAYDLICDPGTAKCISAPGSGEPCFDQFLCGPGNYCDGGKDFTCQPRKELGDGCGADAVCPVDASCVGNICTANGAAICNMINWP